MFRTLIIGLGALIVGMLAYLYSELAALREAAQADQGAQIVLEVASLPESCAGQELRVDISSPEAKRQIIISAPGRYTIRNLHVTETSAQSE